MAHSVDCCGAAASENKKHSAKRVYHAVRKCDSLKAPAIFFAWEDCNFYVDNDENEGVVDWKSFEQLVDAVKYLTVKEVPKRQGNIHPSDVPVHVSAEPVGETASPDRLDHVDYRSQRKSRLNESIIAASATTPISASFTKRLSLAEKHEAEESWIENFRLLLAFQAEHGTCNFCAIVKDTSEKYKGLPTWVRTIGCVPGFVIFMSSYCGSPFLLRI